jgi:hypothetical protein
MVRVGVVAVAPQRISVSEPLIVTGATALIATRRGMTMQKRDWYLNAQK